MGAGGGDSDGEILTTLMQLHPILLKASSAATEQQSRAAQGDGELEPLVGHRAVEEALLNALSAEQQALAEALEETRQVPCCRYANCPGSVEHACMERKGK